MELDATVWVTVPLQRTPLFGASNGTNRMDKLPEIGNLPYLSTGESSREKLSHTPSTECQTNPIDAQPNGPWSAFSIAVDDWRAAGEATGWKAVSRERERVN